MEACHDAVYNPGVARAHGEFSEASSHHFKARSLPTQVTCVLAPSALSRMNASAFAVTNRMSMWAELYRRIQSCSFAEAPSNCYWFDIWAPKPSVRVSKEFDVSFKILLVLRFGHRARLESHVHC